MALPRISAIFLILMFTTALSACGKTGPLYLPESTEASQQQAQ